MHRRAALALIAATAVLLAGAAVVELGPGTPPPGDESPPAEPQEKQRDRPAPPGASERGEERARLVEAVARSGLRRPVRDEAVLEAMRTVPRHEFVPEARRRLAYRDSPLPIGFGQTISQPYIVAVMTEVLELEPDDRVLEIGTGSAYQAAVLAHLTPEVYSIEILEPLFARARATLREQGYDEVTCRNADGYFGWPEHAPFDAVIVTCAAGHLPPPLWEQLAPGGRIVIPIGGPYEMQRLVVVTKKPDGSRRSETLMPVRFVPMTGEAQR